MNNLKILFDADMILFRACASCEKEICWGDDLWTLHTEASEVKNKVDEMVVSYCDAVVRKLKYEGAYSIVMCLSDSDNFRKGILSSYKLNRQGKRKPLAYSAVSDWMKDNYTCVFESGLEADDCLGIIATKYEGECVIVSGDKDFRSIPGRFYNFLADEYKEISREEADYFHLFQTLVGDTADNYKGCPGVGAVKAKKLLDEDCSWATVVKAFEKAGLSEEEAIVQARVARILRVEDYDEENNRVRLWTPISYSLKKYTEKLESIL